MKTYNLLFLTLAAFSLGACNNELEKDLKDVNVTVETNDNVVYDGKIITVTKGTPIKFNIGGDPDNITFLAEKQDIILIIGKGLRLTRRRLFLQN